MSDLVRPIAEWCAAFVEVIGIGIISIVAAYALGYAVIQTFRRTEIASAVDKTRKILGRGIILGLEFLVAADIIHTVAVEFTFKTVGVLAVIVLIRTFLSFTLEAELTGKWPWQQRPASGPKS